MSKTVPLISIIVPAYNCAAHIDTCMRSILAQTYQVWELIVVNDGSTDDTADKLKTYEGNRRINVVTTSNQGVSAARNLGLSYALGDFVTFVDSDDYIEPDYLSKLLATILKHSADIAQCSFICEYKDKIPAIMRSISDGIYESRDAILMAHFKAPTGIIHIGPWAKLFRHSTIADITFDTNLDIYEDALFVYECCKVAGKAVSIDDHLYHYVQHENSAMASKVSDRYKDYFEVLNKQVAETSDNTKLNKLVKTRYTTTALHLLRQTKKRELRSYALKYRKDMLLSLKCSPYLKIKLIALSIAPGVYYKLVGAK